MARQPLPQVRKDGLVSQRRRVWPLKRLWSWGGGAIALASLLGWTGSTAQAETQEIWHHLPEYTALVLLLDTTEATWQQLNQFHLFKLLEDSLGYTPNPMGLPLLPVGLDFQTQVQPWVGDTVVMALLPAEPGAGATFDNHLVMVAPIADPIAFAEQQPVLLALQAGTPDIEQFADTTIYVWTPPADAALEEPTWEEPVPAADGPAVAEPPLQDDPLQDDPLPSRAPEEPTELDPPAAKALPQPVKALDLINQPQPAKPPAYRPSVSLTPGATLPLTFRSKDHEEDWSGDYIPVEEGDELDLPLPIPSFGYRGLALAVLPDALVVAETPAAIKQYLTYRADYGEGAISEGMISEEGTLGTSSTTLADSREFQRTLANRTESRAMVALYANALEILNYELSAAELAETGLPLPVPPSSSELVQSLQAINFGGTLEALVYPTQPGIQFRGRYYYDAVPFTLGLTPTLPEADRPLQLLPAATYVMASGRNLAGLWRGLSMALEVSGDTTRNGLDWLRSGFTALTGLDLDEDVMRWMDGEFAIAAFPHDQHPFLPVGVGVLMQTSDRPAAEATLTALDTLMAGWDTPVEARMVNQQPVTSWELYSLTAEEADLAPYISLLGHGWATDDTLLITSGIGPMTRIINPTPHDPLADFFLFEQATAAFPNPNNGYFYVNLGATTAMIYQVFGLHSDPTFDLAKPFVGSVRSLSGTTAQTPRYIEINGLLGLAPRRNGG